MRLAIIGTGYWGSKIAETARSMKLPVKLYDIEDSLDSITPGTTDGVIIATPANTHKNITKIILRKGIDVLVEKPAFMNMAEYREIEPYTKKAKLMSGHILLYSEHFRQIKRQIEKENQQIRHIECRRLNWGRVQTDISPILHLAPHDVAMFDILLGRLPDSVKSTPYYINNKTQPDYVLCDLKYGNVTAQIQTGWLYNEKIRDVKVFVEDGIYDWKDEDDTSHFFEYGQSENTLGWMKSTHTSLTRQIQAFVDYCLIDKLPDSCLAHTKRVTYIVECMQKSLITGEVTCPSKEY
jgi:predicted dehydrogenase